MALKHQQQPWPAHGARSRRRRACVVAVSLIAVVCVAVTVVLTRLQLHDATEEHVAVSPSVLPRATPVATAPRQQGMSQPPATKATAADDDGVSPTPRPSPAPTSPARPRLWAPRRSAPRSTAPSVSQELAAAAPCRELATGCSDAAARHCASRVPRGVGSPPDDGTGNALDLVGCADTGLASPSRCPCPAPQCVVAGTGACVASPWWLPPVTSQPAGRVASDDGEVDSTARLPIEDGRCVWDQASQSDSAEQNANDDVISNAGVRRAAAFAEAVTRPRRMFPVRGAPLFDPRNATCLPHPGLARSELTVRPDGILHFTNVCVKPRGRLTAAYPLRAGSEKLEPPEFGVEYGGFDRLRGFHEFLSARPPGKGRLREPPCIVRDAPPIVLIPMVRPSDNHLHVTHRVATAMEALRRSVGGDFAGRVAAGFVATADGREALERLNAFATFYRAFTDRWFVVEEGSSSGDDDDGDDGGPLMCVEHVYVAAQTFPDTMPSRGDTKDAAPTGFTPSHIALPFFGPRNAQHVAIADAVRDRLFRCFGAGPADREPPPRRQPSGRPSLVLVWRSGTRRLAGMAALLPPIVAHWRQLGGGAVNVVEHIHHDPRTLARLFSAADVVVGVIGAGLTWSALQPRGGVVVELSRDYGCSSRMPPGWGTAATCEYGGNAASFGQQHLTARLAALSIPGGTSPGESRFEFLSLSAWRRVLDAAVCRLGSPLTANDGPTGDDACRYDVASDDGDVLDPSHLQFT